MKLEQQPEISWRCRVLPYAPHGVKRFDDDDDDETWLETWIYLYSSAIAFNRGKRIIYFI